MKSLIVFATAIFSMTMYSAETKKPNLTSAEIAARKEAGRKIMLEKTGGMVEFPGRGKIAVVNCQTKISKALIEQQVEQLRKIVRVNLELLEESPVAKDSLFERMAKLPDGVASAMYLIDDASLPMSLHAPEACWMLVNVDKLNDSRFPKEFSRASSFLFGCSVSKFTSSPMQTVTKPEDLDKIIGGGFAVDSMPSIQMHLNSLGVIPKKRATYRKACMDGWAAQPTNDYQKAIWEEVHAKPTNPMRIKYDPKKGE